MPLIAAPSPMSLSARAQQNYMSRYRGHPDVGKTQHPSVCGMIVYATARGPRLRLSGGLLVETWTCPVSEVTTETGHVKTLFDMLVKEESAARLCAARVCAEEFCKIGMLMHYEGYSRAVSAFVLKVLWLLEHYEKPAGIPSHNAPKPEAAMAIKLNLIKGLIEYISGALIRPAQYTNILNVTGVDSIISNCLSQLESKRKWGPIYMFPISGQCPQNEAFHKFLRHLMSSLMDFLAKHTALHEFGGSDVVKLCACSARP
ncbi:hypothetical protein DFP72DRAFT_852646 [Ephemerocybe angulata]|uniref:Uncharacterized protein n=1 Tax=Ephemerocybe angulata TaxID=980116 RepID=A0A8H6HLH2_9AGAR|nr:hypothetical protein DFP72DRAFT_852646 [Tulosesus angulatus]